MGSGLFLEVGGLCLKTEICSSVWVKERKVVGTGAGAASQEANTCCIYVMKYYSARNEWKASLLYGAPDFSDVKGLESYCIVLWW